MTLFCAKWYNKSKHSFNNNNVFYFLIPPFISVAIGVNGIRKSEKKKILNNCWLKRKINVFLIILSISIQLNMYVALVLSIRGAVRHPFWSTTQKKNGLTFLLSGLGAGCMKMIISQMVFFLLFPSFSHS